MSWRNSYSQHADEEFFSSEENNIAIHTDAKSSSQAKWIDNWAAIPEGMHTVYFTFMKVPNRWGVHMWINWCSNLRGRKPESVTFRLEDKN